MAASCGWRKRSSAGERRREEASRKPLDPDHVVILLAEQKPGGGQRLVWALVRPGGHDLLHGLGDVFGDEDGELPGGEGSLEGAREHEGPEPIPLRLRQRHP